MYYKNILNKTIHLTKFNIIRNTESFVNDYLITILNLWIQIYDYSGLNPILPIKHSKILEFIQKRKIFFPEEFTQLLTQMQNISKYNLGTDKLLYYYYYYGVLKPFTRKKYHQCFFKEWCNDYLISKKNIPKLMKKKLDELMNDKYFPKSNDYMIHFQYIQNKYCENLTQFNDMIYFLNKLWFYSERDIGYIYHKNSKLKFNLVEDHRYEILKFHKKLFQITNNYY